MRNSPCPGSGDHDTEQQDASLVDRALQRHGLAANDDLALERAFVQSGIGSLEQVRHSHTPWRLGSPRRHFKGELAISLSYRTACACLDTTNGPITLAVFKRPFP